MMLSSSIGAEGKGRGKMTKVIFNIYNPSLIINIWVDTDKLISLLHTPSVHYETSLLDDILIFSINSPLPFFFFFFVHRQQAVSPCPHGERSLIYPDKDELALH